MVNNHDSDRPGDHSNTNDSCSPSSNSKINNKRSRISRACDACRRKKLKCDVDSRNPCSTCIQYDSQCTFNDTTKKRGPPKGYIESLENRLEKMEELLRDIANDDDIVASCAKRENLDDEARAKLKNRSKFMRYHGSSSGYHHVNRSKEESNDDEQQLSMYHMRSFNDNYDNRMRRFNTEDDDLIVVKDATSDEITAQQAEDTGETVDDLVPRSVLSALIYTFFTDAHTVLSVVEKENYLDAFEDRTTPPPAPLLTYAICTYACFLLKASDPIFIEAQLERDNVFQTLLERATSLVRKEYLKPCIVTIQALVLLCAHPTYSTSSYRNWILAGMAVRMALDLGLHRTISTVELSKRAKERNKHLWYSVYITDRWCCAVMGRPLAIADSDCDVDLPATDGYDGTEDFTMFVNFVKLSRILGQVLRRVYSAKAKLNGYKTKAIEQTVYSLESELEDWFLNVPDEYKVTEKDLQQMKNNPNVYPENSKKMTEGGPLTVCYYAVVLLLHRPFMVMEDEDKTPLVLKAFDICKSSAKQSIEIARSIPYMAIAKFGWNFAAYAVFQAALIHVYNCTHSDPKVAQEAKEYVHICIEECLGPLGKDVPAGPPLIPFLQTLSDLLKTGEVTNDSNLRGQWQQTFQQPAAQPMAYDQAYPSMSSTNPPDFLGNLGGVTHPPWLLNGTALALSQTAWQQLFSCAGAPYKDDSSDVQGLDSLFMSNSTNNFYI